MNIAVGTRAPVTSGLDICDAGTSLTERLEFVTYNVTLSLVGFQLVHNLIVLLIILVKFVKLRVLFNLID